MTQGWGRAAAPSLEDFDALARAAFDRLPDAFKSLCGDVVLHVAETPSADILDAMGVDDPLELTGLYEGVDRLSQSVTEPAIGTAHVHLYRLPILLEWAERGDVSLGDLIVHVLVHEIGHHFGLSDEDMHRIEAAAGD